jgi:hypothetical protein
LATSKRGLKRGLKDKERLVALMLDETIICEIPPLYYCYGHKGEQVSVPIIGTHNIRVLHGAINILTGEVLVFISNEFVQETHQYFLSMIRSHWRGWNIVIFEDRATPHTAEDSLDWDLSLGIEIRLLPKATPELNAMDQLWRRVKGQMLGDKFISSVEQTSLDLCDYIYNLTRQERLKKAGILSKDFWLKDLWD